VNQVSHKKNGEVWGVGGGRAKTRGWGKKQRIGTVWLRGGKIFSPRLEGGTHPKANPTTQKQQKGVHSQTGNQRRRLVSVEGGVMT